VDGRLPANLRSLGIDADRSPEIPPQLAGWIEKLRPEDTERIRAT
jgi:hypothetical protein